MKSWHFKWAPAPTDVPAPPLIIYITCYINSYSREYQNTILQARLHITHQGFDYFMKAMNNQQLKCMHNTPSQSLLFPAAMLPVQ